MALANKLKDERIKQLEAEQTVKEGTTEADEEQKHDIPEEESKQPQRGGTSHLPPVKHQNFCFLFGTKSGSGLDADSNMAVEVSQCLERFNPKTLITSIPDIFEQAVGKDASYETIISSTAQTLGMQWKGDIVARSVAVVFVTTELKGYREYSDVSNRTNQYVRFLKEALKFDEVQVLKDLSRDDRHKKMDELEAMAAQYEQAATGQDKLLIAIVNLGFKLSYDYNTSTVVELMPDLQECSDGTQMTRQFIVTQDG